MIISHLFLLIAHVVRWTAIDQCWHTNVWLNFVIVAPTDAMSSAWSRAQVNEYVLSIELLGMQFSEIAMQRQTFINKCVLTCRLLNDSHLDSTSLY